MPIQLGRFMRMSEPQARKKFLQWGLASETRAFMNRPSVSWEESVLAHRPITGAAARPEQEVFLVGTVQEEFNLRGAMLAARVLKPDIAIALDVALAGDTPDLSGRFPVKLGGGPVVSLYNFHGRGTLNGTIAHRGLADLAIRAAKEADIPLQRFASTGILTDSAYVQLENEGIAALDLGFPARYTHTPVEACNPEDIEQLARLIREMLGGMDETFRLPRY